MNVLCLEQLIFKGRVYEVGSEISILDTDIEDYQSLKQRNLIKDVQNSEVIKDESEEQLSPDNVLPNEDTEEESKEPEQTAELKTKSKKLKKE